MEARDPLGTSAERIHFPPFIFACYHYFKDILN